MPRKTKNPTAAKVLEDKQHAGPNTTEVPQETPQALPRRRRKLPTEALDKLAFETGRTIGHQEGRAEALTVDDDALGRDLVEVAKTLRDLSRRIALRYAITGTLQDETECLARRMKGVSGMLPADFHEADRARREGNHLGGYCYPLATYVLALMDENGWTEVDILGGARR